MTKFFSKWGNTNLEMEGNLTPMIWAAQLLVAVFFIAGFVSFYTEIWNQAFVNPHKSQRKRTELRIFLLVLSIGIASVLHFAGYISGSSSMMYHNLGLFILVFALLDEEINLGEYLIRCAALLIVWAMHHFSDLVSSSFAISMD